ncbi:MAG: serine/threonine-protein kinase [Polyangiales bacterium]
MPHLTPSDRIGTTVGGRYEIRRLLGEGGFSAVFESVHNITGRSVALKLLHPHLVTTEQITERFLLEARAMARIRHDGIVQVLDAGKDPDGTVYIALELLEGEALETTLQRVRTITWSEAASIGVDVLAALAEAHRNKIVHRDIKPGNIFVTRKSSGEAQAKLLDFGIAHVAQAKGRFTQQGVILGTPEYMSPEQARAGAVGPEADLWSVGVVLFECVTGATPFVSENTTEILLKVQTERAPELSSLMPSVPVGISDVVRRALERDVSARFHSADEMREALQQAVAAVGAAKTSSSRGAPRGIVDRRAPAVTLQESLPKTPEPAVSRADAAKADAAKADAAKGDAAKADAAKADAAKGDAAKADAPSSRPSEATRPPRPRDEAVQVIRPGRLIVEEVVSSRRYDEEDSRPMRRTSMPGELREVAVRASAPAVASKTPESGERPRFSLDDVIESNAASAVSTAKHLNDTPTTSTSGVQIRPMRESGPELRRESSPRISQPDTPNAFASSPRQTPLRAPSVQFTAPPAPQRSGTLVGVGVAVMVLLGVAASALLRPTEGPVRPTPPATTDASVAPDVPAPPAARMQLRAIHEIAVPAGVDASEFARHVAVSRGDSVTTQRVIATCAPTGEGTPTLFFHPLLRGDPLGSGHAPIACAGFDLGVVGDVTGDGTDDVIAVAASHDALLLFNSSSRQVSRSFALTGARGIAVGGGFTADNDTFAVVYTEPGGDEQPGTIVALGLRTGRVRWRASGRDGLERFGQPVELGLAVGPDVNRDGVADVVVGLGSVIGRGRSGAPRRCVQVLSGATGEALWSPQCRGRGRGSQSVTLGPDVNHDGVADVVVGVDRPEREEPAVEIRSGTDGSELRTLTAPPGRVALGFGWPVALIGAADREGAPLVVVGSAADASTHLLVYDARAGSLEGRAEVPGVGATTLRILGVAGNTPSAPWSVVVGTPSNGVRVYATVPRTDDDP